MVLAFKGAFGREVQEKFPERRHFWVVWGIVLTSPQPSSGLLLIRFCTAVASVNGQHQFFKMQAVCRCPAVKVYSLHFGLAFRVRVWSSGVTFQLSFLSQASW